MNHECSRCEQLENDYDQLQAHAIALEDQLVRIHATALNAVSIEERREAWLNFAPNVT